MNDITFKRIVYERTEQIHGTLGRKAGEYASEIDRLHNFKAAANLATKPITPEQAIWGMVRKHLVSVMDMVDATADGKAPTADLRNEKIGDAINYLILLEALLTERRWSMPQEYPVQQA